MVVAWCAVQGDQHSAGQEMTPAFEPPHPGVRDPRGAPRGTWSPLTNGLLIACLGILVFSAIYAAATCPQVGPVGSWRTVSGPSGMFTIQAPTGWQVTEFGEEGVSHTVVVKRSRWVHTFVHVYPRMAEEVSIWGATEVRSAYGILAQMHSKTGRDLGLQFRGMTEGRASRTELGGCPAMWSRMEFSDDATIYDGEKMSGVRVTMARGRAGLQMVALAPAESWRDFEPVAMQIFRSINFGNGQNGR